MYIIHYLKRNAVYDLGLRLTLPTRPIAPMTIWWPPCCFEGELAEIEHIIIYKRACLEFGIPFQAVTKSLLYLTKSVLTLGPQNPRIRR